MKRGEHAADDGSFGRSATGAMGRGIGLIIAAVVLGLILLNATDGPEPFQTTSGTGNSNSDTSDAGDDGTVDEDEGEDGGSTETTETTLAAVRPPGDVTVLVANGSGVRGAAAGLSDTIAAAGYLVAEPANAPATVQASAIHYVPGYEQEAQAVASLLTPAPPVTPMPTPQPIPDLRGANVLVLQGPDLAPQS